MEQKLAIPPLEVKASIKLVRWVCLVSGIIYGIVKKREYGAIEKVLREEEERERPEREARELREKLRRNAAEMRELERIFLGTSSTETEEKPNETPCDETITSKDNSSALNDNKKETVISPNNKSEETNDKVVSKDESDEAL
ncbi:DNA ligase 1-like [Osmia bicornis bicornis]|uniref:DNA ligase 1-like n=1 Tax=Osmia bicornis bicornis TaxID=1437191 RepID=UPI0010F89E65|nr:DNA ligase 1-like [Osmia bicornis bicornis]